MMIQEVISILIHLVAIILHITGFCLLYNANYTLTFNKIQRFSLLNLSFVEILVCTITLTNENVPYLRKYYPYIRYINLVGGNSMLFLIYYAITVDRLLMVYYNLRYQIVVTMKRVRLYFCLFYLYSFIMTVVFMKLGFSSHIEEYLKYIFITMSFGFIILSIITYSYMAVSNKRRKAKFPSHQKSQPVKKSTQPQMLPFLLILTFLLFIVLPILWNSFLKESPSSFIKSLLLVTYAIGFCTDALLYIFSLKRIKRRFNFLKKAPIVQSFQLGNYSK